MQRSRFACCRDTGNIYFYTLQRIVATNDSQQHGDNWEYQGILRRCKIYTSAKLESAFSGTPLSVQPSVILLTRAQFLEAFLYRQTYGLNSTFMSSPANDADYAKFLDLYKRGLIPLRVCRECLALICQPSIILYRITCSFGAIGGPLWLLCVPLRILLSEYSMLDTVITLPDEVGYYSTLPKQNSNIFFR